MLSLTSKYTSKYTTGRLSGSAPRSPHLPAGALDCGRGAGYRDAGSRILPARAGADSHVERAARRYLDRAEHGLEAQTQEACQVTAEFDPGRSDRLGSRTRGERGAAKPMTTRSVKSVPELVQQAVHHGRFVAFRHVGEAETLHRISSPGAANRKQQIQVWPDRIRHRRL